MKLHIRVKAVVTPVHSAHSFETDGDLCDFGVVVSAKDGMPTLIPWANLEFVRAPELGHLRPKAQTPPARGKKDQPLREGQKDQPSLREGQKDQPSLREGQKEQ